MTLREDPRRFPASPLAVPRAVDARLAQQARLLVSEIEAEGRPSSWRLVQLKDTLAQWEAQTPFPPSTV